ncbi:type I polyketide synthase [Nocardia cyriacigeorgica]|uniref:type I polyketide synthase n=1 Tax=Nocardia cyriacigeorgica TaxID=135487 RepID=UPI002455C820|nr:type I polyketide synthase [Nocardia cyriacigeorgica]
MLPARVARVGCGRATCVARGGAVPVSDRSGEDVRAWLISRMAELGRVNAAAIDGREPFTRYGLDSRTLTMLAGELSEVIGRPVPPAQMWAYPTPNALAGWLAGAGPDSRPQPESVGTEGQPIAIVGLACRFPGARDPAAYWRLIRTGADAVTEPPTGRWVGHGPTRGGYLDEIDTFDPEFFGISPREAPHVDPQQRLMLELMHEALDDAGIPSGSLADSRTGAFVGAMWSEYGAGIRADADLVTEHTLAGGDPSIIPARMSYTLGARGPSLLVNTACSSSLVAVHLAMQSLHTGECDLALAGGVSLMLARDTAHALAQLGALAPDGRSKSFDARADGYGRGEGAGMIVLKPLQRALAEGNPIHGVLLSSAVNHDGFTNGLTAPSLLAQESLLRSAYRRAGVTVSDVGYVEAHGTGTVLGDPIEAQALGTVLGAGRAADRMLPIGSVKSAIGHLEPAAGIAGLIKVLLAMRHRTLPPSGQFERANPHIPFDAWGLRVLSRPEKWHADAGGRRLAGVSSFGFGGTNCHVVLDSGEPAPVHVLPLAAESEDDLRAAARELMTVRDQLPLEQLCASAWSKAGGPYRLALSVRDYDDVAAAVDTFCKGSSGAGITTGTATGARPRITFVFGGQGSQWTGMGAWLLREPAFRAAIDRCEAALGRHVDWSLIQLLTSADQSWIERTELAQPAIFAMQVALAELWRARGVEPDAVAGMSMGEVAAAHIAGAISLDEAAFIMCRRSASASTLSGHGAMAVFDLSVAKTNEMISRHQGLVWVAGEAGPESTVVSGDRTEIEALRDELAGQSVGSALIRVDYASHCPFVDPTLPSLRDALADVRPRPTRIPFFSSVTGDQMDGTRLDAEHWVRTEREPWQFRTTMARLLAEGDQIFIDVDPHPILTTVVEQNGGTALPSLRRGDRDCATLVDSLGALFVRGAIRPPVQERGRPQLLVLSARSSDSLAASATAMARMLSAGDETALADVCYTAAARRDHHEHRLAVIGSSPQEFAESLRALAEGRRPGNASVGVVEHGARPQVVFVCSGQGSQWTGMGTSLLAEPVFRAAVEQCDDLLRPLTGWSLITELTAAEEHSRLHRTEVAQPALFAMQVGVASLWREWGLEPAALIGHSVGEVAAAHLSGALSLAESIEVVYNRSRLMQMVSSVGEGGMASVERPAQRLAGMLDDYEGALELAAANDPYSSVVSGSDSALADLLGRLRRDKVVFRELRVGYAFHSARMDPAAHDLTKVLGKLAPAPTEVPVYSTVSGKLMGDQRFDADYWGRNVRDAVRFADAVNAAISDGHRVFAEIGPHPVLLESIQRCLDARRVDGHAIGSTRRNDDERTALLRAAGALYTAGCAPDFERLFDRGRVVSLPSYPWRRQRYWLAADQRGVPVRAEVGHPLLGAGLVSAVEPGTWYWQRALHSAQLPYLADLAVHGNRVLSAAVLAEMACAAAAEAYGTTDIVVSRLEFEHTLEITTEVPPTTQAAISTETGLFQLFSRRGPDWMRHVVGTVGPDLGTPEVRETPESARRRTAKHRDGNDHYRAMAEAGLDIGEHLRGISELWFGHDEVVALVEAPASSRTGDYRIHPAVLDAGLQALIALHNGPRGSHVVTGIGRLRVYRTPTGTVWAHGRSTGSGGDLYLLDEAGRVLVAVEDVVLRPLPPAEPDHATDCVYTVQWRESADREPSRQRTGRWVVFAGEDSLGPELADALRVRNTRCDLITAPASGSVESLRAMTSGQPPSGIVYLGTLGSFGATALSEALAGTGWRDQPRLWLVTRAAHTVGQDGAAIDIEQASLWGLGRMIGLDHPQLWVTRVDLPAQPMPDEASLLASQLLGDARETDVALRSHGRFVARLVQLSVSGEPTAQLRADGVYLIVCEDVAPMSAVAQWLADRGARRIVLLAPSSASGAVSVPGVRVLAGDAYGTDDHAVNRLIAEIETGAGPLRGVIHAGTGDSAWRWHQHTLDRRLDLFVLCSSVGAWFGRPGDALDSARLDAIAQHRRALGLPGLSLHLAGADFAAYGVADAPVTSLVRALDHAATRDPGRLVVMDLNLRHWFESFPGATGTPLFDAIETRDQDTRTIFASELGVTPPAERVTLLEEHLIDQISLTLQQDPASLGRKATFQSMGMGSIMAVEVRNRLESTLGLRLPAALLFTYSTIASLAEFIAAELETGQPSAPAPSPESTPEDEMLPIADIGLLSDAEAEAMLLDSIRLVEQESRND